jgi:hypothetical protein
VLLVVTYSSAARQALRNVCRRHEGVVVRQFGRAALLAGTERGAFHALRLRAEYRDAVQVERTAPLNEFEAVPERVRAAATAYAERETPQVPYEKFRVGRDHPPLSALADREL